MTQWWDGRFPVRSALCTPQEREAMPGMARPDEVEALRRAEGRAVEAGFVTLMSRHHAGAVRMADQALGQAGDLRVRPLTRAIRYQRRGEIGPMHGAPGLAAAARNLVLPDGQVSGGVRGPAGP